MKTRNRAVLLSLAGVLIVCLNQIIGASEQPILSTCRGTTSMTMLDKCHFVMKTSKYWLQRHTLYLASWARLGFGHCGTMAGPGPARRYFIWEGGAGADAGATVVLPAPTRQMPNKWPLAQAEVFFYWSCSYTYFVSCRIRIKPSQS